MKKRFALLSFLLFIGISAFAQNSTQGTEFWFSFMHNGYKENEGTWVETQDQLPEFTQTQVHRVGDAI